MNVTQRQPIWLLLAIASGACAAFNGVFAKLTTTDLTTTWSRTISSSLLSLDPANQAVNYLLRAVFFGLNLAFNVAMWALFTAALTRASSTTRVSVVNVSANFVVTALLGLLIFGENLPPLWWLGAALLAAGNVVIGRREETGKEGEAVREERRREEERGAGAGGQGPPHYRDEADGAAADMIDLDEDLASTERAKDAIKKGEDVDAPLS